MNNMNSPETETVNQESINWCRMVDDFVFGFDLDLDRSKVVSPELTTWDFAGQPEALPKSWGSNRRLNS